MTCPGVGSARGVFLLVVIAAAPLFVAAQGKQRPTCPGNSADKCCQFPMFTDDFFACCDDNGCCPKECLQMPPSSSTTASTTTTDPEVLEPTPACERGRKCCRYPPDSMQFAQCCEEHRCRPKCDQVSRGCCYNGKVFEWGGVVEAFEEACVNLVCAAEERDEPPFLAARLVLVRRTDGDCNDRVCESPGSAVCVDATGAVRREGEEFYLGECNLCTCRAGGKVDCRHLEVKCKPLPTRTPPRCQVVQGPCCAVLNCSVERTCPDSNGQVHALYATWKSDPCTSHQCTLAGITTTREECEPKPYPNCVAVDELEEEEEEGEEGSEEEAAATGKEGEGEEDGGSLSSEENEEDENEDKGECCPKWKCGQDCRLVKCSFEPPGKDCKPVFEPLACCPKWECSGCMDDGKNYHPMGSSWHPTPCTTLTCTPLGVVNTTAHCKPKPHEVCTEDTTKKGCCPVYECGTCTDKDGKLRPMFSKWEESRCNFRQCTPRGIVPVEPQCKPRPHENCFERSQDEECCPQWECGPDCRTVRCGPPPQNGCLPHLLPLACCPQYNCSVCVDETGQRRKAGSSWRTDDPCINKTCTETGEVVSVASACALGQRPREGCFPYTPEGECCPTWNCSGCLDSFGVFYKLYQAWNTDPCTSHFCGPTGIITRAITCPLPGPREHPNCELKVPPGQCCSEWICGPDCRLVFCPSRPEGDCTSHRPPLTCCDEWTCNGCTDDAGKQHNVGQVWLENNCLLRRCTKDGITTTNFCNPYSTYQRRKRYLAIGNGSLAVAASATIAYVAEPLSAPEAP